MKNHLLFGLVSSAALLAMACGATAADPAPSAPADTTPGDTATADAGAAPTTDPVVDHGAPSTTYPAFTPAMGQLQNNGGAILTHPVIVTVTWPGDEHADDIEKLGDTVGAGNYWKQVTSEYGSLAASSGAANHVRLTDAAPASMSDTDLVSFVAANVGKATDGWPIPGPTGNAVYILYLPRTTALMLSGKDACSQGVGGYHDSTVVNTHSTAFAIIPRCDDDFDRITVAASHELAEATTDPYPKTHPAWTGFRPQDLAWEFFQQFQSENGDACEFYRDSAIASTYTDVPFTVQRQWSNENGKAGHDPCVPIIKGATYFNVTPLDLEDVKVDLSAIGGGKATTTKGYNVKVGETRQIPLGFYSDGALDSWTIKASVGGIAGGGHNASTVDLSLDVTEGQNGQKAYLTATVNTAGRTGTELVTIVSSHNGTSHYMPLLLASASASE
jgi:hypothetical protein